MLIMGRVREDHVHALGPDLGVTEVAALNATVHLGCRILLSLWIPDFGLALLRADDVPDLLLADDMVICHLLRRFILMDTGA